ncbi:nucleoside deaminase [Oscillospiraceae bacterium OttesenSCG-928-G22]|nr:nucleoside deaminase [Oscillospiraceae bacterium OttesenSCG-928-G22]
MREALALAGEAAAEGEVPVGCVVTRAGVIVGRGRNRREIGKNALFHAELEAIHEACRTLSGWRLHECDLFVTLEPCPMCAGAILNARIRRVCFGAPDPKGGAMGGVISLFDAPFNHHPQVTSGVLEADCAALLRDFFAALRKGKPPKPREKDSPEL